MCYLCGFLCLLISCAAYSQTQPKPQATQTQQTTTQDQHGTDKSPITIKILPAQNADANAAKQEEYRKEKAKEDWWITKSTVWLALVTTILAIFTAALWWATRKLVIDAKETSKKELRAYIGMGGGEVFKLPNNILRGVVEIKNFGETPAHNVMVAITGELRAPGDKRQFNDPDFIPHKQPIAPTMSWTFGHEFLTMTPQDLNDVLMDKKLIYIWGHVKYQDIYNETQTLRFRLRNVVKLIVTTEEGTAIEKWKFYPEAEGNEAT